MRPKELQPDKPHPITPREIERFILNWPRQRPIIAERAALTGFGARFNNHAGELLGDTLMVAIARAVT